MYMCSDQPSLEKYIRSWATRNLPIHMQTTTEYAGHRLGLANTFVLDRVGPRIGIHQRTTAAALLLPLRPLPPRSRLHDNHD